MLKKIAVAVVAASTTGISGLAVSETVQSPVGEFDVSMTATLATDYIWRGQSQTAGKGAVQGSLDIAHESGLYAGIWASNVDGNFAFAGNDGSGADVEFDYYLGYGNNITEDISYDVSVIKYEYPGASVWNYYEFMPSISAYGFTLGYKYAFETDSGENPTYTYLSYEYELPAGFGLLASVGRTDQKAGGDDYNDWAIGLGKTIAGLDFAVTYTDSDFGDAECVETYGKKGYCDSNVTLSVSKSF